MNDMNEIGMFELSSKTQPKGISILYKLKLAAFSIFHRLIQNYFNNQLAHILLLFIETVLLVAYPISLNGTFGSLSTGASYLVMAKSDGKDDADVYLFAISISVTLLYVGSFLVWVLDLCIFSHNLSSPKEGFRFCARFYGFFVAILQYVLELPLFEMLLSTFAENYSDSGSSEGVAIFMCVASGFCFFLLLALSAIIILFFHDEQISSNLPWTMSPLILDYLKLVLKVVIAGAAATDPQGATKNYILIMMLVVSSGKMYSFLRAFQMDKRWVQTATVFTEVLSWLIFAICIFNDMVESGAIDYLFLLVFLVPVLVTSTISIRWRRHVWLLSRSWTELRDPKMVEEYVRNLLLLVDSKEKLSDYPILMGLAKQHSIGCQNKDCVCHLLETKFDTTNNLSENHNSIEDLPIDAKVGKIIYNLAKTFVQEATGSEGKQAKLLILSAYIHFILLGNKFQALYDLQQATELVPSVYEEYLIFRLHCQIEQAIVEEDRKETASGNNVMANVISFQEKYIAFQDLIIKTTDLYIKFWKELLKDYPGFKELADYGYEIAIDLDLLTKVFESLIKISHTNIKTHVFYSLFLSMVAQDAISAHEKQASTRLLIDNYYINKKATSDLMDKYGGNGKAAIVIMSGNRSSLGIIKNVNHEMFDLLGYNKDDILGSNISVVMPELFGGFHYKFIQRYFSKTNTATYKERMVFPEHMQGYILPSTLLVKLLPNLHNGIQFIGFMTRAEYLDEIRVGDNNSGAEENLLFLLDQDMKIHGFNRKFVSLLGGTVGDLNVHKYLDSDQKFSLSAIFPDLFTPEKVSSMHSAEGFEAKINLFPLVETFQTEIGEFLGKDDEVAGQKLTSLCDETTCLVSVNIKMKDFKLLEGALTYKTFTIFLEKEAGINAQSINALILEANGEGGEEQRANRGLAILEEDVMSQTTSSSCSQSQYEVRLIQDFRGHVRERKDPSTIYYFRISSYFLLVALTVLTSVSYWLKLDLNDKFSDAFELTITNYDMFHTSMSLPFAVRTLRNIYLGLEPTKSELIPDRVAKYKGIINEEAAALITEQRIIDQHHALSLFKERYDYYYTHGLEIIEVDQWDGVKVTKEGIKEQLSLSIASQKLAAKCLGIADFDDAEFKSGKLSNYADWDRKVATVLYNFKRDYRLYGEKLTNTFLNFVLDYADSQRSTYLYIVLSSTAAVMFAMLSLLPFIVRAHTSVINVYRVFIRIKKNEYIDLINQSEEFLADINKPFAAVKKCFNDINFKEAQRMEQEVLERAAKNEKAKKRDVSPATILASAEAKAPPLHPEQKDDDELEGLKTAPAEGVSAAEKTALASQLEVLEIQRKEQTMSATSSRSRNILLIQISGIALMFGIYFLVTILMRIEYFAKVKETLNIVEVIARRKPYLTGVDLFAKEDFTTGTIYYDHLTENESLFRYYYWEHMDNELRRESLYDTISGLFPDLYKVMRSLDSAEYCSIIEETTAEIEKCQTVFEAALAHGLESASHEMLRHINVAHYQLENYLNLSQTVGTKIIDDYDTLNYLDMYEGSMEKGAEHEFRELTEHAELLFDSIKAFDTWDFALLLVLLFIVLLITFRFFLNQFEFSLWKTKRMLGILPTKYMAEQINDIKTLIKQIA